MARLCWLALVVLHLPGIWAAALAFLRGGDLVALFRCAAMAAAAVFFVLKIVDLPVLRFRPGWRSPVSLILIVLLMHVGVIERAFDLNVPDAQGVPIAAALFVAVLTPTILPVITLLCRLFGRLPKRCFLQRNNSSTGGGSICRPRSSRALRPASSFARHAPLPRSTD